MSEEESDEEPIFIGMATEEEMEHLRQLHQPPKRTLTAILKTINTGKGGTEDLKVAMQIYKMEQLKDIPSIDPSTNITGEIDKLMFSHGIRPPPKPNPSQADAIKKLRDINELSLKDTSTNLKGEVNKLMSSYGIR